MSQGVECLRGFPAIVSMIGSRRSGRYGMKLLKTAFAVLAFASLLASGATAQQYPTRPVKVLVTILPGGAPDIAARLLAQRLTETMGQSFFIENRSGANGNVAAEMTAHAEPDGYT